MCLFIYGLCNDAVFISDHTVYNEGMDNKLYRMREKMVLDLFVPEFASTVATKMSHDNGRFVRYSNTGQMCYGFDKRVL
jgi:hypothetical protein